MISDRIQNSYRNVVNFEDAMNQAFSEIFQNLQVINEDTKKQTKEVYRRRSRKVSAAAIWYPAVRETEEKTTTFTQPNKETERKFSEVTAQALSTVPSLQSLEKEDVNTDQVDVGLGCQDKVNEEDSAEKQREDVDIQPRRRRISAPVRGTSETTTLKQPKKKMERKLSVFTAPALSAMPSLQSLEEEEVNIDQVDIGLGYHDKVIERDTEKRPRRRRVSAPARTNRETAETTTFKQLKKDLVRKLSRPALLPDLALSTMPWLAECFEEELEEDFEPVEFNLSFLDDLMKL